MEGRTTVSAVVPNPHSPASAAPVTTLVEAWLARDITTLETGRRIHRHDREALGDSTPPQEALRRLFPPFPAKDPDPSAVRLLLEAALLDGEASAAITALADRRDLLEAVLAVDDDVIDVILRPGERVLLGTVGGRTALSRLLDGATQPFVDWLGRTVLDEDAFVSTTSDVPLHDLGSLRELISRLATATEALPPGPTRAMVADEWVAEMTVAALDDDVPFADVARTIGETLLEHTAPILLWHAAHELALVTEDDPALRARVLERCLAVGDAEAGRCPAEAAAALLGELSATGAIDVLDRLSPRLDTTAWRAIGIAFLRRAIATQWHDWREDVRRWSQEDNPRRALAAFDALLHAPAPEPGAITWFTDSDADGVRLACRGRLGLEA